MTPLPTQIRLTGEGWNHDPRVLVQVERTDHLAIYAVYKAKDVEINPDRLPNGKPEAYEVVRIRKVPCREIFGKTVEAHEAYPRAGEFGPRGKYVMDLDRAQEIFNQWVKEGKNE